MTDQSQKAGADSQQYQAGGDINIGVTAEEVVDITRAEVARSVDQLTAAAKEIAEARNHALGDRIIGAFEGRPELFQAFADPDFQFSLRDAARAAASTDEVYTEELLVDLLTNRAEKGASTRVRLATSQAIKAADKLSLEALNGLTALWAIVSLRSSEPNVASELKVATEVADVLIALKLPTDAGWVRELDVLNLGRTQQVLVRTQFKDIVISRVSRDLVTGIDVDTSLGLIDGAKKAIPEVAERIEAHPLKPGFVKLAGKDKEDLLSQLPAYAADISELQQLIGLNGYGIGDNTATANLAKELESSRQISTIANWWNSVPVLNLTMVGEVVAFVNARRHMTFQGAGTVSELLQRRAD
jgi:hypothetical protein